MKNPSPARLSYHLSHRAPLYFLFLSVLCQIIAFGAFLLLQKIVSHPVVLVAALSLIAFALARWLKLTLPWQILNLLLVPGVILFTILDLPHWIALILLALIVLLYLPTFWTRVPYYPTNPKMYEHVLSLLPAEKPFNFVDLGCGFGGLMAYLAKRCPQGHFHGIELSPLAFLLCRLRFLMTRHANVKISLGNFWTASLSDYDVIYAFLSPTPMPYLWEKVRQEAKSGAIFVTNTFAVEAKPSQTIEIEDTPQKALFIYRM